jgi:hypothetical protein
MRNWLVGHEDYLRSGRHGWSPKSLRAGADAAASSLSSLLNGLSVGSSLVVAPGLGSAEPLNDRVGAQVSGDVRDVLARAPGQCTLTGTV